MVSRFGVMLKISCFNNLNHIITNLDGTSGTILLAITGFVGVEKSEAVQATGLSLKSQLCLM